jgi:hypothetical protein
MNFELTNNILKNRGLNGPTLEVLDQDANLYSSLLFQPTGTIEYTDQYIRITKREMAGQKFNGFFNIAIKENVELAITPEYSCPWAVVNQLINDNRLPQESKLWIVGCESIQAQQLLNLFNTCNEIEWIYNEEKVQQNLGNSHFFDPVCYLFKTRLHESNELKTVAIVQFKTHFMGGIEWERDNFIAGEKIYVLQNATDATRLFTLICSDALNASSPQFYEGFMNIPHLIVHIQLNKSPNHQRFSKYRCDLYGEGWEDKEVLCLNWARRVQMNNSHFHDYGGTAFYTQSNEIELHDSRINHNHTLGAYYTSWKERYATIYLFNYDEFVFFFRNTKPSQRAAPVVNRKRTGLEMLKVLSWNIDENKWSENIEINSGFAELCNSMEGRDRCDTLTNGNIEKVNIERLIALSVGKATRKNWHNVQKNEFFLIGDDGVNKRITFTQDPSTETSERRRNYLIQFARLSNHIVKNDDYFPDTIADLRGNCEVNYQPNGDSNTYNMNLFPIDSNGSCATGIYKGETDKATALETYEKTTKLFDENQNWTRIVVWYRDVERYQYISSNKPKITDNPSKPINSISSKRR